MVSRGKPRSSRPSGHSSGRPARNSGIRKRRDIVTEVVRAMESARGDLREMLSMFARTCVPDLGEMCIVDLVNEEGSVERVDAVHVDPSHAETMRAMQGPFTPRSEHPLTRVIATRRPMLERIVGDRGLARIARNPAHLVLLRRFGPLSSMRLPLVVGERTVAVLTFCITDPSRQHYSPSDMALAQQLVARVVAAAEG